MSSSEVTRLKLSPGDLSHSEPVVCSGALTIGLGPVRGGEANTEWIPSSGPERMCGWEVGGGAVVEVGDVEVRKGGVDI